MNLLIIGSGGREHALGVSLKKNKTVKDIYFAPGNGGTKQIGKNISITDVNELCEFAKNNAIDLTFVGSEELLVAGIVDKFQSEGLTIFGPHKTAAQLEGNKAFAKEFMQRHGVKTATYQSFTDYDTAKAYLDKIDYPSVIKASGLAAGKGVVIVKDKEEAHTTLKEIMLDKIFGDSGNEVVIEEFLEGVEVSVLSYYNGKEITPFISAKDHKKIGEGETGLNTGGMGVVAPNPYFTEVVSKAFQEQILEPTLDGLIKDKLQFSGVIFFGLMITHKGVYLLEYNLRMGDPETQAVLPLLKSDLLEITQKTIAGEKIDVQWKEQCSCCVVMASGGYPKTYNKGYEISGLESLSIPYFIAGAELTKEKLITTGGRVLNIVAVADTADTASEIVYKEVQKVCFKDSYYRRDIK